MERKSAITFKGAPLTLLGAELSLGASAPNFTALDRNMNEVRLSDFSGKAKLISVVTSLDTEVCDLQLRRFNEEASKLPEQIALMNISMDLPFAIDRFCATAGIDKVTVLSDYRDASFGTNYGVLIKEMRLLARSVFLIDSDNTIRYLEIVPEILDNVNFDMALNAAGRLLARR